MKKFDWGFATDWTILATPQPQAVQKIFVGVSGQTISCVEPLNKKHRSLCRNYFSKPGFVLMPGLINAHTHLAMTLFRGFEDDVDLKTWLFEKIFPAEHHFVNPKFVKLGTQLAALECLQFGTTTVADMYFFPEQALQVWDQAGLRGLFSQAVSDFPTPESRRLKGPWSSRFLSLSKKWKSHPRLTVGLGPHAPYSCSAQTLAEVAQVARETNCRIQIHVAESENEVAESLQKFKKTPVQYLVQQKFLNSRVLCAHMVHTTTEDQILFQKSGAHVVYNPDSNLKLASGLAPLSAYKKVGINVALGTDGAASNNNLSLFGAMNLGVKAQKVRDKKSESCLAADAFHWATMGGAKALGLDHLIGSIEVGKKADLVLVDFNHPHLKPVNDPLSHLVYSCTGLEVDSVMVDGRWLMKNKKQKVFKAASIFREAEKFRKKLKTFQMS